MDPVLEPLPDHPTAAGPVPAVAAANPTPPPPPAAGPVPAVAAANPTPAQGPAHNHPPYAEMITTAISTLKERNGSSKRAIAKYIETNYSDLPSTHAALLTHHLKRLKTNGQLVMVKLSYKLPRSAVVPAPVTGAVNAVSYDPVSCGSNRRPGRPPKPKPDSVQVAVPVFEPPINVVAAPVVVPVAEPQPNVAIGPVNGTAAAVGQSVRGRGRPPKRGELKRGPGRPPRSDAGPTSIVGLGGGRGRTKFVAPVAQVRKGPGRPHGRLRKPINVVDSLALRAAPLTGGVPAAPGAVGVGIPAVVAPMAGKRGRGRPPRAHGDVKRARNMNAGQAKPRMLSGKPLGRPKKNASAATVNQTPDSQLLVAYLDLKAKLGNLQSRITQTANFIKPSLNNEAAINALQELELIAMNVTTPPIAQNQQQQPQPPSTEKYPQQPPQS